MEIRRAAGVTIAAVALLGFATAASAQPGGFGGGRQGGGFGRFGMFGGQEERSNPLGLLMRSDVQTHLHITLKQKQQIEQVLNGARDRQAEQMRQMFQNRPQPGNAQGLSREERRQQMREQMQPMFEQMRATMQKFEGELNDQIKSILTPEQAARLYQLDYQWRGPLALADPKVAQEAKLSAETQQAVAKIVEEYRTASAEARRQFFESLRPNDQQGQPQAGQRGRRQGFDPQDFQARMAPLQLKLDKMKKETEDKVLAALTPQEKANWQALNGEPFTFRKDIQTGNPLFFRNRGGAGGQGPGGFGRPGGNRPF